MFDGKTLSDIALFMISPDMMENGAEREKGLDPAQGSLPVCEPGVPGYASVARSWIDRRQAALGACKTFVWLLVSVAAGCGLGQLQ